jgi:regulator of replication initiation timing
LITEQYLAGLTFISAISGLLLQWLNHRRQSTSSIIEDLNKTYQVLAEENERLRTQIQHLRKDLENEVLKRVALQERLDTEREIFSRRIQKLEAQLGCEQP